MGWGDAHQGVNMCSYPIPVLPSPVTQEGDGHGQPAHRENLFLRDVVALDVHLSREVLHELLRS